MTALFWVDLWPLNRMKMTRYSACLVLLILFRTNSKKGHLDENDFRHCDGNFFSKVAFWKLLGHSYVQIVPSQQLRRHTDNSIWRDTLQLYILRTWINMRTKSFTKTSVNVTEMNIWTKIETTFHLFYALLFLWNLVFKFNLVLIRNFFYNFDHNLFTLFCLFFPYLIYRRP